MHKDKTVLIIDDSDADRMMLNAMLCGEFEVIEKCGGYTAVDFLRENSDKPDLILLDISMPGMDGFGVIQFMKEAQINDLPVFLMTSEATRDNVEKALQYGVAEFIKKPIEKEDIINKIRQQLGIFSEHKLTNVDIRETYRYISELETVYKRYLINFGQDYGHYTRVADLMKIMLTNYAAAAGNQGLDREHIQIISKAGFFYDIGNMIVPPKNVIVVNAQNMQSAIRDGYKNHTILGAELVGMNHAESCRYFVDICRDICMHHHERYDGTGFPHKIKGERNLFYTQLCRLAGRFDSAFSGYREHSQQEMESVLAKLGRDEGDVSREVFEILPECGPEICGYYHTIYETTG